MQSHLSIVSLVTQASLVVQLVMLILLSLSIWSWVILFRKWKQIKHATARSKAFETAFWAASDLASLLVQVQKNRANAGPLERIFEAGLQEYIKGRQGRPNDSATWLDSSRRAMQAAIGRELEALDQGLPLLATVGSVSPYIGLFGTVWGIMNSFRGLANVQQSTLANVAPGIAEALVATAIGLFAAIPATVAYNRYAAQVDALAVRCDNFMDEFLNILQRQSA